MGGGVVVEQPLNNIKCASQFAGFATATGQRQRQRQRQRHLARANFELVFACFK